MTRPRRTTDLEPLLTRGHLEAVERRIGGVDREILERSVRALVLVTRLAETGLPFVFKGGTSLLLRLRKINRLSIDVDITTETPPEELSPYLESVREHGGSCRSASGNPPAIPVVHREVSIRGACPCHDARR
jgi:hypothetical protein